MRKFTIYLMLFCVFANNLVMFSLLCRSDNKFNKISISKADDGSFFYAKCLSDCSLYKSEDFSDNIENIYFQVPETYFVTILDKSNENYYKVQYGDFIGYVKPSTVILSTFVPIVKTLENVTFDIKSTSGTQIWKYPVAGSEICTTISAGTKNLNYIASIVGKIPSGGQSNVWYYVHYTPESNSTNFYEGYIYSENTTNLSDIVINTESNPEVISEETELKNQNLVFISSTIKTIVISVIAVPVILFFAIILYKIIKKFKKNTKYTKNNLKLEDASVDDLCKNTNAQTLEKYKNLTLVKHQVSNLNSPEYSDEDLL